MLCLLLTYIDRVMSYIGALPRRDLVCSLAERVIIRIITQGMFLIRTCIEQSVLRNSHGSGLPSGLRSDGRQVSWNQLCVVRFCGAKRELALRRRVQFGTTA